MEEIIKISIYIHAFFGGIGLISGLGSILVKKGRYSHIRLGRIFSYSMIISSLISLVISNLPNHKNLFLFLIGIFTIYLVLAGNQALTFKNKAKEHASLTDQLISGIMMAASMITITIGIIGLFQETPNSVLYLFFGGLGGFMTVKDFRFFRSFKKDKKLWLKNHLGRMIGALIASITAFIVAGLNVGTIFFWIAPSILGSVYIAYWNKKLQNKTVANKIFAK
ncbi:MAG: hypothetical protein WBV11_13605 [Salegentibacter sp.]